MPGSGWLHIHVAVLLFGLAGLFGKFLDLAPAIIVLGRTVFAALVLGALLAWQGRLAAPGRELGFTVLTGAILAVHWVTFFQAIQVSTVAVGLLGFASFPVFVTLLEPWVFGERYRPVDFLTAVLVATGLVLVAPGLDLVDSTTRGLLWGLVSGASFAVLALVNRARVRHAPPLTLALYQNLFAALCLLPALFVTGWHGGLREIALLAFLGVFCTALAHALFIASLRVIRAQLASVVSALEPVYGITFAFVLLGERPAPSTLAGGALIIGTLVLAARARQSPPSVVADGRP